MYGFYQVGQTNIERRKEQYHERRARYAIAPFLQAEADREYLERELVILQKEKEIMKDHPDWVVGKSAFHSKRFMPRAVNQYDRSLK
jgi:NADH dehydrogenase (ubiquinone) 1 alpha subcomplex subunit 13